VAAGCMVQAGEQHATRGPRVGDLWLEAKPTCSAHS